ncbi:XRE family transcriptional regulator [Rhodococcus sp. IEGM 1401]|uniref:helix-turn-helix domain-containing protein n=1 Tax=unclassified Rhodococcus (in: high G+C Gram-positive bacteria) TaxID=192944 RepID=UPI0022B2B65D|nr:MULTISPECIES: XRE family transcriptional regulator [unclassified Rhodococcus (in: high G+C Gram-positive bacteria)]MCZ4561209.1 XRE family transcriptional regulator [Rhodococcus sp. IEGM 1401]MDI9921352.1 XRE family transcriptional regulator [Rhodococcus sp. IEGM 1372]MDI9928007.1 XRE family transcriptional regulator [Rhodococcus sp. IEGM 1341]MDV8033861.1 XRE family transcriptional regulator [Rhodococcus sp. IEGM 1414]MDV8074964.1 XRE family transcriptional regulator [Rhodococcus sp. IEGM 
MSESQRFASVWDALSDTPAEAENLKVRSALMIKIKERIDEFGWSQTVAARNLGVTQPRISDLKTGKIDRFSVDNLINMAGTVGLTVSVNIDAVQASTDATSTEGVSKTDCQLV